jgi:hypothetical protein
MSNALSNLSVKQLKKAIKLREKMEVLQSKLDQLLGSTESLPATPGKRKVSAAGRARMAAAQKARWAGLKGEKPAKKGKRTMSASAKAKIAASARLRWKKAKAAGKNRL